MKKFLYKEKQKKQESGSKNLYDSLYSNREFFFGLEPSKLVLMSVEMLKPNSEVLDLGCGEGKNSFYLFKKGFNVTAVDESGVGVKKLEDFARKNDIDVRTVVSDAESFLDHCANFDSVFCLNMLQFLDEKKVLSVIEKMQNKTNPGGFNVIASFVAQSSKEREMVINAGEYRFNEGELRSLYDGWLINFYKEELGEWETHGGKVQEHRHYKVGLIAQKP